MTPEQLVPTLETSIQARDAGYPQGKSYFIYAQTDDGIFVMPRVYEIDDILVDEIVCDAPTLQELLEELCYFDFLGTDYEDVCSPRLNNNPAEAAALLWLELRKEVVS